jgi:predicted CoA-binding protein
MIPDDAQIARILARTRTIAMAGASPNPDRPSFGVMRWLLDHGLRVIPLNPGQAGGQILGQTAYASAADIPAGEGPVGMLNIFRRSQEVLPLVEAAIPALKPRGLHTIWMQLGIENAGAAELARSQGLHVVMNRCLKVEWRRLGPAPGATPTFPS